MRDGIGNDADLHRLEHLKVLYTTNSRAEHTPLRISSRQVVAGPRYESTYGGDFQRTVRLPPGRFDLEALIRGLPEVERPQLIVCQVDAFGGCWPENVARVPGKKVRLIGDTHHGPQVAASHFEKAPLQKLISYSHHERFDFNVLIHDPHHVHWFAEGGLGGVSYLPAVNAQCYPMPLLATRTAAVLFVGTVKDEWHTWARRERVIDAVQSAGLPVVVEQVPPPAAAVRYNSCQICLNCSLNGDLNMRVFEILGAGGFLITDRLASQAHLERLFRRGEHYVDYGTIDELLDLLHHYLARPGECLRIAAAGKAACEAGFHPERKRLALWRMYNDNALPNGLDDARSRPNGVGFGVQVIERARVYEFVQELCRRNERVKVVVDAAAGARAISDLVDLPRATVQAVVREPAGPSPMLNEQLANLNVLDQVSISNQLDLTCDVLVGTPETPAMLARASAASWVALIGSDTDLKEVRHRFVGENFVAPDDREWLMCSQTIAGMSRG